MFTINSLFTFAVEISLISIHSQTSTEVVEFKKVQMYVFYLHFASFFLSKCFVIIGLFSLKVGFDIFTEKAILGLLMVTKRYSPDDIFISVHKETDLKAL